MTLSLLLWGRKVSRGPLPLPNPASSHTLLLPSPPFAEIHDGTKQKARPRHSSFAHFAPNWLAYHQASTCVADVDARHYCSHSESVERHFSHVLYFYFSMATSTTTARSTTSMATTEVNRYCHGYCEPSLVNVRLLTHDEDDGVATKENPRRSTVYYADSPFANASLLSTQGTPHSTVSSATAPYLTVDPTLRCYAVAEYQFVDEFFPKMARKVAQAPPSRAVQPASVERTMRTA